MGRPTAAPRRQPHPFSLTAEAAVSASLRTEAGPFAGPAGAVRSTRKPRGQRGFAAPPGLG